MVHFSVLSCLYFSTALAFVAGFSFEPQTNVQRTFPNIMSDLNRNAQHQPSRNTKRMTIDENTRSREGWGQQMNTQYYNNPYQSSYYPNMRQNTGGNNPYFSSTAPPAQGQGAIIDIFKGNNKPPDAQGKVSAQITVSKMQPLEKKVKVLICKLQGH